MQYWISFCWSVNSFSFSAIHSLPPNFKLLQQLSTYLFLCYLSLTFIRVIFSNLFCRCASYESTSTTFSFIFTRPRNLIICSCIVICWWVRDWIIRFRNNFCFILKCSKKSNLHGITLLVFSPNINLLSKQ